MYCLRLLSCCSGRVICDKYHKYLHLALSRKNLLTPGLHFFFNLKSDPGNSITIINFSNSTIHELFLKLRDGSKGFGFEFLHLLASVCWAENKNNFWYLVSRICLGFLAADPKISPGLKMDLPPPQKKDRVSGSLTDLKGEQGCFWDTGHLLSWENTNIC